MTTSWRDKAHRIIGQLSRESYERENRPPGGKLRKRTRPYSIPETAQKLIKALGDNDEETAKAIFLFDYDAQKAEEKK